MARTARMSRMAERWSRAPLPRWTVRLRLTVVYGGLFLLSGVAVLAITYFLVSRDISKNSLVEAQRNGGHAIIGTYAKGGVIFGLAQLAPPLVNSGATGNGTGSIEVGTGIGPTVNRAVRSEAENGQLVVRVPVPKGLHGKAPTPKQLREQLSILKSEAQAQQTAELHVLLFDSGIALVAVAAISVLAGWLVAGRALRPLRLITSKAQDISATNLHERIGLGGPDDEMKRLGDTFDDLLARLERSFAAQRQFVANASHELRTPLARQRTLLEVAAADPDADVSSLREASARAIAAGEEQERLLEAMLTLASSERGLDEGSPFDLADAVRSVLASTRPEAELREVDLASSLEAAPTTGNERLAEQLVANLVENALRYNAPGGWVAVATRVEGGHAVLQVDNSGPAVPETEIERLFEPFQRLAGDRITKEGNGLGLSIVRAVARAHGAAVTTASRPAGGLAVRVDFPLDDVAGVADVASATEVTEVAGVAEGTHVVDVGSPVRETER